MDALTRIERGRSFDAVAATYEKVRPSYPQDAIATLVQRCALTSDSQVLEIGAGSGKATELLAQYGFNLTCVEPGPALAQILQRRFAGSERVRVNVSSFEEFPAAEHSFDAVIAAQAFHWLRPEDRLTKSHALLKPGGSLALLWNMSPRSNTEFFLELYRIYDRLAAGLREPSFVNAAPPNVSVTCGEELRDSPLFRDVHVFRFPWTAHYSSDEFLQLLDTYSNHRALEASTRAALYAAVGHLCSGLKGTISKEYVSILYLGKAK